MAFHACINNHLQLVSYTTDEMVLISLQYFKKINFKKNRKFQFQVITSSLSTNNGFQEIVYLLT